MDSDVFGYLPQLKNNEVKEEDYDGDDDSSWFSTFVDEVRDDLDQKKLHQLVIDYLICNGYKESAELLCTDSDIEMPSRKEAPNIITLEQRDSVRTAIVFGDIEGAILKINDLAPKLLMDNTRLHFKLMIQQIIELIRNRNTEKVLRFAQDNNLDKYLDQRGFPPELFTKLEQTYALLAFDSPENSPFGLLLQPSQRNILANEVNIALLSSLQRNPISKLEHLLRMMVWNQHQYKTKGDARPLSKETAEIIAKQIFANEDEQMNELL